MGVCDSRQMHYPGAEADPISISESWLASQVCTLEDIKNQFCWIDGDYVYFLIHIDDGDGIQTQLPPTTVRRILVDDLNAVLRNDLDAELYWDTVII